MEHNTHAKEGGVDVEGLRRTYTGSESAGGGHGAAGDEKKAAVTHSETV